MSIHHSAMDHLDKAIALKKQSDYDALRYAVLELRYGIECLVYELLPGYEAELPDEVLQAWKPSEILQAIVSCNPDLPHFISLSRALEGPDGKPMQPMQYMGTQTGITPKSLLADYNRLGSFLHARKPRGDPHPQDNLNRSVAMVIESLERYRGDAIIANFAERHHFACRACGREIVRRVRALDLDPFVRCPNKDCRAIHERIPGEAKGEYRFRMVQQNFVCPFCKVTGFFDLHRLQPGVTIKCRGCSKEFLLRLVADPKERPDGQSAPIRKSEADTAEESAETPGEI